MHHRISDVICTKYYPWTVLVSHTLVQPLYYYSEQITFKCCWRAFRLHCHMHRCTIYSRNSAHFAHHSSATLPSHKYFILLISLWDFMVCTHYFLSWVYEMLLTQWLPPSAPWVWAAMSDYHDIPGQLWFRYQSERLFWGVSCDAGLWDSKGKECLHLINSKGKPS